MSWNILLEGTLLLGFTSEQVLAEMIQFNLRIFFLGVLISMMFMPYVAFLMISDEGLRYTIEAIALLSLYITGLVIPLVQRHWLKNTSHRKKRNPKVYAKNGRFLEVVRHYPLSL